MNRLILLLDQCGTLSAKDAATRLGVNVSTINRYAHRAGGAVLALGRARHSRYALPLHAYSDRAQWPLYWISESGVVNEFAQAALVKPGVLHVYGPQINVQGDTDLPWPLTPLQLRGFLGRTHRTRLGAIAAEWDTQPERWRVAQRVFAAQAPVLDHAGAVLFGDGALAAWREASSQAGLPDDAAHVLRHYDELAARVMQGTVAGSSADGEQPKFSTRVITPDLTVRDVLVKFSPPRDTPFGERWNDLLRAEAHTSAVLSEAGFAVPHTRVLSSSTRTYLESARIDRTGPNGRRHLLPLSAVHRAFIADGQLNWPDTVRRLVVQKRLLPDALITTQTLFAFGHLIGNSDMHFGNLGVIAANPTMLGRGQFSLAPIYDMLPMRFAPAAHETFGLTTFVPAIAGVIPHHIHQHALALAVEFWTRCAQDQASSKAWRALASAQRDRPHT
jgi:hypothetical protein